MKRMITILAVLALFAILLSGSSIMADEKDKEQIEELEARIQKLEMQNARDRIRFTGDLRVTADSISATLAPRVDGLALQKGMVDTLFYAGANGGAFPMTYGDVQSFIADNYADYLYFQNGLTFEGLKEQVNGIASMPGGDVMIGNLFAMLMDPVAGVPGIMVPEQDYKNDIVYTTRLRLNMNAKVKENVSFTGRLGMYKTWGDSTGMQVFNGQTNTFSLDGTDVGVPNSDILRVERAYFDWKNLGGSKWYLSIGRRPSTGGPPLHIKDNELRQGTPNGHVVNFQFDGITLGDELIELVAGQHVPILLRRRLRSRNRQRSRAESPGRPAGRRHAGRHQLGHLQHGRYAHPDHHTGRLGRHRRLQRPDGAARRPAQRQPDQRAPVVLRYTPSAPISATSTWPTSLIERNEGPFTWFVSLGLMSSEPDRRDHAVRRAVQRSVAGYPGVPGCTGRLYAGMRFNASDSDMLGLEYNHGSKYWFNFTQAADDLVGSKLATRGDVYEAYWLHEFKEGFGRAKMKFRLSAMLLRLQLQRHRLAARRAQEAGDDMMPVISAFPTYSEALDIRAALTTKF